MPSSRKTRSRGRFAWGIIGAIVMTGALVGYGVAQSTQVTQAEWARLYGPGIGAGLEHAPKFHRQ